MEGCGGENDTRQLQDANSDGIDRAPYPKVLAVLILAWLSWLLCGATLYKEDVFLQIYAG